MSARSAADRLVLGTWGLAGRGDLPPDRSYGEVTAEAAYATMDRAWAAGLRTIDTAPGYGAGQGLRRVGHWQRTRGLRWRIAAKPGRPLTERGPVGDLTLPGLVAEVAAGTELAAAPAYVLVKDPAAGSYADGTLAGALTALEGRFPGVTVGVASHLPERLAEFAERSPACRRRIAQIELNAVNHRIAVPAAARLAARGWEVWTMQPLAYGFLASPERVLRPGADWRSGLPHRAQAALRAAARGFARAVPAVNRAGPTGTAGAAALAAWAIAFCLSVPSVTRTVIGPKNATQLEAALLALELVADPETVDRLRGWAMGTPSGAGGAPG